MAQKSQLDDLVGKTTEEDASELTEGQKEIKEAISKRSNIVVEPDPALAGLPPPVAIEPEITLDKAMAVLKEHVERGHVFSFAQMDLGVEISLLVLPPEDQEWFREIAEMSHVPLWQALWAQYRRSNENGLAQALILDPGWTQEEITPLEIKTCPICHQDFQQTNSGQLYDPNEKT